MSSGLQKMTKKTVDYLNRAKEIHGDKYDYSLVEDIKTNKQYIDILCPIHGKFSQAVANHICAKQGCPRCGGNFRKSTEEVMKEIRGIHGDLFEYIPFEYKTNKQKIGVICREHGEFWTIVKEHLHGGGCPRCARNAKMDTSIFVERAKKKHGDIYDYSLVEYTKTDVPVTIICRKHGQFQQTPHGHLMGYGCSRCVANSSKKENEWLDSLGIPGLLRLHRLKLGGKRRIVDGFDPTTNTVYEFYGDYFHGNAEYYDPVWTHRLTKKTFGELYRLTMEKERMIKEAGYNLVTIWESDFCKGDKKRFRRKPVAPADRTVNKLAFMRQWQMADEDWFDYRNFAPLFEGSWRVV
jgi:hypothetical protein